MHALAFTMFKIDDRSRMGGDIKTRRKINVLVQFTEITCFTLALVGEYSIRRSAVNLRKVLLTSLHLNRKLNGSVILK